MAGAGCPHPECLKARTEATNMARYGVARPLQSDAVKAKARATSLEKYGAENVMQSDFGKARMAEACREKFGADSPLASPEVRGRILATRNMAGRARSVQSPFGRRPQGASRPGTAWIIP